MADYDSFADSFDLTEVELNSLSKQYSLLPDDPRLRLPWDFSNFTTRRSRRQIASSIVQLNASTTWLRKSGGQIRIFDGDFGDRVNTYWPGATSSEGHPYGDTGLRYKFDQYGQPMWSRLCVFTKLPVLRPEREALQRFLMPSSTVVTNFSKEAMCGLLPLKRETRALRRLFKCVQAYSTTQHFLPHLSVDHLEIHIQFAWYQRELGGFSGGLLRGNLYGSSLGETLVQQTWQIRATVHTSEGSTPKTSSYKSWATANSRWAILIAEPPRLRSPDKFYPMQITLLREIHRALHSILQDWDSILSHIQSLLSIEEAILHPELHDKLLFDEQDFSTSRKYFWIINSTEEFHRQIEETEKTYSAFFKEHIEGARELFRGLGEEERLVCREGEVWEVLGLDHERILKKLGELLMQLRAQRDRAVGFRDGLFSASSVLESRASTRLGQNVKLLTYVSIFYLPLGFITSLWSISSTALPTASLIPTIITVGLTTYILVFNLNNISSTIHHHYLTLKKSLLQSMQNHNNHSTEGFWPRTAKRYNQFAPPTWDPHPSEWLIFAYLVMMVFTWPFRKLGDGVRWFGWWGRRDDLEMGEEVGRDGSGEVEGGMISMDKVLNELYVSGDGGKSEKEKDEGGKD